MSWMADVTAGAVGALLVALLLGEAKGWAPRATDRMLSSAVKRLPAIYQARLAEEWSAAIADMPTPVSKAIYALNLRWAAERIRWRARPRTFGFRIFGKGPGGVLVLAGGAWTFLSRRGVAGIGWFALGVVAAPSSYLLASRTASERAKVEALDKSIAQLRAEIRTLRKR
jgi:hypothetical protein